MKIIQLFCKDKALKFSNESKEDISIKKNYLYKNDIFK